MMSDWTSDLDWSKSALLVIDMQNDYCHWQGAEVLNGGDVTRRTAILPAVQVLIDAAHRASTPVIFIRTTHDHTTTSSAWASRRQGTDWRHPYCLTGTWGAEYFGVLPEEGDIEVTKHRFSGFVGTDLELRLRALGRETLIIAGVDTNVCVESTMRDGYMRDFSCVLVADATAAGTADEHAAACATLGRYFGWTAKTTAVVAQLDTVAPWKPGLGEALAAG